jgi:hypothetical protein
LNLLHFIIYCEFLNFRYNKSVVKPLSAKIMLAALDLLDSKISAKHKSVKSVRACLGMPE